MDFWTAFNDASTVITVSGFVWQVGKRLFKKNDKTVGAKFEGFLPPHPGLQKKLI